MLLEVGLARLGQLDGNELEAAVPSVIWVEMGKGASFDIPTVLEAADDGADETALWSKVSTCLFNRVSNRALRVPLHTWTPSGLMAMKL